MTWLNWTTLGIAIFGAVLGLINTVTNVSDRRVKLRVVPSWSLGADFSGMSIEVTNLGAFPITLTEVGFTLDDSRGLLPKRLPILDDRIVHGNLSTDALGRHESKTIIFHVNGLSGHSIRKVYARTSSGVIARGTSGALKQFIAQGNRPI